MNQSILFNDDFHYDEKIGMWCFTGISSGEIVTINIYSEHPEQVKLSETMKLDWEMLVEDWLEDNEPINALISLTI